MTILRMDNVLLVVDDLEAVKAFFVDLGLELEGETVVEGDSVDRLIGLDGVRATIASMRTPDGHGRIELDKFHTPAAVRAVPEDAPVNALGYRRIMFAVDDIDECPWPPAHATAPSSSARWCSTRTSIGSATSAAPRASWSPWRSISAEEEALPFPGGPPCASRRVALLVVVASRDPTNRRAPRTTPGSATNRGWTAAARRLRR